MRKELAEKFNQDVERYRQSLLYYARMCDWDTFKAKAAGLFDYVEEVEISEIQRRFFAIFKSVLIVLVAVVIAIMNMDVTVHPDLQRVRYSIIVLAVAGTCFEIYSVINYRTFMRAKAVFYKRRKDRFVSHMVQDFREYTAEAR